MSLMISSADLSDANAPNDLKNDFSFFDWSDLMDFERRSISSNLFIELSPSNSSAYALTICLSVYVTLFLIENTKNVPIYSTILFG